MTVSRLILAGAVALSATAAFTLTAPASADYTLRVAALGDLSTFRAIAADTLALIKRNDLPGAQKRGTDLETAWDRAEDTLKPTDPARWRVVDKAIDRVLAQLRAPSPRTEGSASALSDLLATMDKGGAA